MAFPSSPSNGDTYTAGGITYIYDSTPGVWKAQTFDTVDAGQALTKIKTVDGSGSGLDADTLDGLSSASFLRKDVSDTLTGTLTVSNKIITGYGDTQGIEIGDTQITSVSTSNDDLIIRANSVRFGSSSSDWNYDEWAGLSYDNSQNTLYIGGPRANTNIWPNNAGNSNNSIVNFIGITNNGLKVNGNNVVYVKSGAIEVPTGSTDPSNTTTGAIYFNTNDSTIKQYDGTSWVAVYEPPLGSQQRPAANAKQISDAGDDNGDGLYWLQNSSINGGAPFQAYCDMTTAGGGWTLIVCNSDVGASTRLNYTNGLLYNFSSPSATSSYSILQYADLLKSSSSGFQYMIEGVSRNRWGGIWTANSSYSFTSTSNGNTNITLNSQFDSWSYNDSGIEARMPYRGNTNTSGWLTTSGSATSSWWGTLIQGNSSYSPAPYMSGSVTGTSSTENPGTIWYWVR